MYKLIIHKRVRKFLESRSGLERKLVKNKISLLKENPFDHPGLDLKKMKGVNETYRLRIGKIRIIYQVLENELLILIISGGTRGDIYKKK